MKKLIVLLACISFSCNDVKNSNKENTREEVLKQKENEHISKNDCATNFDIFFERFSKDSVFQKKMIKYPLESQYYDDYEKLTTDLIKEESYKYRNFTKDASAMKKEYDKYTIKKEKIQNGLLYKLLGYDNGIYVSYEFKLIDGCWFLVKIIDEST